MADKTREQRSATALRNEAEKRLAHLEKISSGGDAEDIQKLVADQVQRTNNWAPGSLAKIH